jgi:hypothetical protein
MHVKTVPRDFVVTLKGEEVELLCRFFDANIPTSQRQRALVHRPLSPMETANELFAQLVERM